VVDLTQKHNYEIMYIVDDQNPEKAQLIKKEFIKIFSENDGEIKNEEDYLRQFAYPINHKVRGHYFVIQTFSSSQNIINFKRVALIKQKQLEIIRFLVINLDSEKLNKFKPKRQTDTNNYNRGNNRQGQNRERNYYTREKRTNDNNEVNNSEKRSKPYQGNDASNSRIPNYQYKQDITRNSDKKD